MNELLYSYEYWMNERINEWLSEWVNEQMNEWKMITYGNKLKLKLKPSIRECKREIYFSYFNHAAKAITTTMTDDL